MFKSYTIWARDKVFFQILYKRIDIESILKTLTLFGTRDYISFKKTRLLSFFCSPLFSKIRRLISENSFDIFEIFASANKLSIEKRFKITEKILLIANHMIELLCGFNFYGNLLNIDKICFFSKIYNFKRNENEIIRKVLKIYNSKIIFWEFLAVSKSIFLEFFHYFMNLNAFILFYIFKWLLVFKKISDTINLKYKWGFYVICSILFPKNFKNKHNYIKEQTKSKNINLSGDLFDGSLYQKSYKICQISMFCTLLTNRKRMMLLCKSIILANYQICFGGMVSINKNGENYSNVSDTFRIEIIDNFDCIGESIKNHFNMFNSRLSYNLLEKINFIKIKNLDFFDEKKKQIKSVEFPNLNKVIFNVETNGDNYLYSLSTIKNNLLIIFYLNCVVAFFYKKKTNLHTWTNFIKESKFNNFMLSEITSAYFDISVFLKLEKKIEKFKIQNIIGAQFESILNHSNQKIYFDIPCNFFLNSNLFIIGFNLDKIKRIAASYYIASGHFKIANIIYSNSGQRALFLEYLNYFHSKANLEVSIRRLLDFTGNLNFEKILKLLGKINLNGKYFELLSNSKTHISSDGKYSLGLLLFEKKKMAGAQKQIFLSVSLNPRNLKGWFYLGFFASYSNDFLTSIHAYLKILNEEPLNSCVWANLSMIFFHKLKRKKEAYISIKQAIKNKCKSFIILKIYIFYSLHYKAVSFENALEGAYLLFKSQNTSISIKEKTLYQSSIIFIEFFVKKEYYFNLISKRNKHSIRFIINLIMAKKYIKVYFQFQKLYGHVCFYIKDFFLNYYRHVYLKTVYQSKNKIIFCQLNQMFEISNRFYLFS
nr:hypothetical protein 1634Bnrm1_p061 [Cryptomonas sp.]